MTTRVVIFGSRSQAGALVSVEKRSPTQLPATPDDNQP